MRLCLAFVPAALAVAGCASSAATSDPDGVAAERDSLRAVVTVQQEQLVRVQDSLATLRLNGRTARRTGRPAPVLPEGALFADTLFADELFQPASATLSETGGSILDRVAYEVGRASRTARVRVEGHADPSAPGPTMRERWPSNFELSSARAGAVARYLVGKGVDEGRLYVVGYAASKTVAPNDTPQNRARNRRVVVVVEE